MSASATYSGTTTKAGRSGRGLGMAAVALAVVIATGVVFAVNQGNEATVSNVNARINEPAFQAESDRLTAIAESMTATFAPNNPGELARIEGLGAQAQTFVSNNPGEFAQIKGHGAQVQTFAPNNPGELARIEGLGAQVQGVEDQAAIEQRLAHEFLDEQRTPAPSGEDNPLKGIAE